jgi:hypothetical protein
MEGGGYGRGGTREEWQGSRDREKDDDNDDCGVVSLLLRAR